MNYDFFFHLFWLFENEKSQLWVVSICFDLGVFVYVSFRDVTKLFPPLFSLPFPPRYYRRVTRLFKLLLHFLISRVAFRACVLRNKHCKHVIAKCAVVVDLRKAAKSAFSRIQDCRLYFFALPILFSRFQKLRTWESKLALNPVIRCTHNL